MKYGIVSRSYFDKTIAETAKYMASKGYNCTELCMGHPDFGKWTYNKIPAIDEAGFTKELTKQKADIFRDHGIEVTSLGVFTNLLSPDDGFRNQCINAFIRCIL